MKERLLKPSEVAEILGISKSAARDRMQDMPGCIDVGAGGPNRQLRVTPSALEAWMDNRVIAIQHSTGKIARRPVGRRRA